MVTIVKHGLFKDLGTETIVNTVNLVGVMGAGIALEFKNRYPKMYKKYRQDCFDHKLELGKMWLYPTEFNLIICFPTKKDWRNKSEYIWIEDGLDDLRKVIFESKIKSIRIPLLGCTNGGLNIDVVLPMMESKLSGIDDVNIIICKNME